MAKNGVFPAYQVGPRTWLIDPVELVAWVAKQRACAAADAAEEGPE